MTKINIKHICVHISSTSIKQLHARNKRGWVHSYVDLVARESQLFLSLFCPLDWDCFHIYIFEIVFTYTSLFFPKSRVVVINKKYVRYYFNIAGRNFNVVPMQLYDMIWVQTHTKAMGCNALRGFRTIFFPSVPHVRWLLTRMLISYKLIYSFRLFFFSMLDNIY